MEPEFPVEFLVKGTPVSLQAKRAASKEEWKSKVRQASRSALPEGHFLTDEPISVTLYYFPEDRMQGDVDNIVKLVLDALVGHIYRDDSQVERIVVQKFEPGNVYDFRIPSVQLASAISSEGPVLYVRLSADPFEELI